MISWDNLGARILLFIAFLLAFGAVIGGAWVLFGYYIPYKKDTLYPGVAIFVQNVAIFIRFVDCTYSFDCIVLFRGVFFSTLILKFGRKEDVDL